MIAERSYEDLYLYRKEEQSKHVEFWEDELVLGERHIYFRSKMRNRCR